MPKIQRKTQKIFCNSADSDQIAVFGSMSTGTPIYSNDVEQLQSNEAFELGWDAATLEDKAPFMEEMNGMQYGITKQLAYNFQEGIPEYDVATTYYIGSIVKNLEDGKPVLYTSITDDNIGNALTDSTNWEQLQLGGGAGLQLFDTILKDHVLTYKESKGLALQGTYVYKEAVAGSRYGYPDFYNKCLEERNVATATQVTLGSSTITMYIASNGHQYYDIANKDVVDAFFGTMGTAWFYGVDTENERIFLPRNNYFDQATGDISEVGQSVDAGLPNITGSYNDISYSSYSGKGAFKRDGFNGNGHLGSGTDTGQGNWSFNASRSNPIYGNSDTVQPNAVKKLLYICVGNTTNYEGMTEVVNQGMEILEQVNQAVNNLIPSNSSLIASYGIPDYSAGVSVSVNYTATYPCCIICTRSGSSAACYIDVNNVRVARVGWANSGDATIRAILDTGDTITNMQGTATCYPLKGAN